MLAPEWRSLLSNIPNYDSEATAAPGDYFDPERAEFALSFFSECLVFIEGDRAGQPFELEPWQAAIVASLWGWRREDGTRRFRECMLMVPRKNGKSPFAAGLLLLSAYTDQEAGAQLYAAAASKEQATLLFRHAAGMIAREPELSRRAKVYKTYKSVEFPETNSIFRALASDADNLHGLNASFVVVDELHAHADGELVDVLVTATASRSQPLVLYITTSDYNRPSVCNQKHDYASKVRDGIIPDPSFLPCIWEALPDEDWTDPEVWKKANPNLGVSVRLDYLERECKRAQQELSYEGTFRRLHLNQRVSVETRWIRVEDWKACKVELRDLAGRECYAGLDLSSTTDLTAFVLAFPPADADEPLIILPTFWVPESKLRDRRDKVPYEAWHRAGFLNVTPGDVVDYDAIRAEIVRQSSIYDVREIRFDRWNSTQLVTQLSEQDGLPMATLGQGFASLSYPAKEFERRIVGQTLGHGGNPVMDWMISNVTVIRDSSDNIKPCKAKSTGRIDGVVAACMAVSGAMQALPFSEPEIFFV